jgi:flagellar biosynthetic protein FliR
VIFGDLSYSQWAAFVLVLVRCSALIITLPFFNSPNIPTMAKAGLVLSLAVLLSSKVPVDPGRFPTRTWDFALLVGAEIIIGAILGLSVNILLTSVQIMGQLVGFQMGFAVANVIDPVGGGQISVLAQLSFLMAILTMFMVNGHHYFFKALADSFTLLPVGKVAMTKNLFDQMMHISGQMFSLAVRLGAPVIGALLFTQVCMGILAKTVPQMNILMVGFPITISVGLIFLSLSMLVMIPMLMDVFSNLGPTLIGLIKAM